MTVLNVISLGAGVQSTTMALMAAHGEITPMPDAAIFADTGAEPPEVYDHLEWMRSGNVLPFPVHVVQSSDIIDDLHNAIGGRNVHGVKDGRVAPPFFTRNVDGSQGILRRDCTENYKIRVIERETKKLLGRPVEKRIRAKNLVCTWIGISSDEAQRVNYSGPGWVVKRYPFLSRAMKDDPQDLWMNRRDCETWLRDHEYPIPPKSACSFCPYRSNVEWKHLRDHSPRAWQQALEVDRLIRDMPGKKVAGLSRAGELFVHSSCTPLEEVDLDDADQFSLWDGECEGICGV